MGSSHTFAALRWKEQHVLHSCTPLVSHVALAVLQQLDSRVQLPHNQHKRSSTEGSTMQSVLIVVAVLVCCAGCGLQC